MAIVARVWEWAGSVLLARHTPTMRGASSPITELAELILHSERHR